MAKAILIDVYNRNVLEVALDGLESIYNYLLCRTFTVGGYLENGDALYVDDEGLLADLTNQGFFKLPEMGRPLAGNCLIVGTDFETGETVDCKTRVEDVKPTYYEVSLLEGVLVPVL